MTVPQQRAVVFRGQAGRETVEAFVVAFILALLFRAFIAEAFVIPTGSMAPALMGAHKDLACQQCGQTFPVGASGENRGEVTKKVVVGGICPNCRYVNPLDLVNEPNHGTFTGDRILVSKFAYMIKEPQRWDVIVFKVPVNAKQNYIKRLVGLPNEVLSVRHGDVYAKPIESDVDDNLGDLGSILRKDPPTMRAMSHFVYDSDFQSEALVAADYPSRLQPWIPGQADQSTTSRRSGDGPTAINASWQVTRSVEDGLRATLASAASNQAEPRWLRYYHRWPNAVQWQRAIDGFSLAKTNPYESRLITDFHAYDAYITVPSFLVYHDLPRSDGISLIGKLLGKSRTAGSYRPSFESGESLGQFAGNLTVGGQGISDQGLNWVGDLIVEADLETEETATQAILEIVESGIRYQCFIDLESGAISLQIKNERPDAESSLLFSEMSSRSDDWPEAESVVRAGQRRSIRMSNFDNQLTIWIDDDVITFDQSTTFDPATWNLPDQARPFFRGDGQPLDASPTGLAVSGEATLHRFQIHRDKYYIATNSDKDPGGIVDYDLKRIARETGFGSMNSLQVQMGIQEVMGQPSVWDEFSGWDARRTVSFRLEEDQFFPMGDNSPESLDARCWAGSKSRGGFGIPVSPDDDAYRFANAAYVPRDLLIGKALMVFWPHPWRSPIPLTPNFKRMKLIH